jgi:hypothetical protein
MKKPAGAQDKDTPYWNKNERFLNDMAPTAYEKRMVAEELNERHRNRNNYVKGVLGRDGVEPSQPKVPSQSGFRF